MSDCSRGSIPTSGPPSVRSYSTNTKTRAQAGVLGSHYRISFVELDHPVTLSLSTRLSTRLLETSAAFQTRKIAGTGFKRVAPRKVRAWARARANPAIGRALSRSRLQHGSGQAGNPAGPRLVWLWLGLE